MTVFLIRILSVAVGLDLYFYCSPHGPICNGCIHNLTSGNAVIYSFRVNTFWNACRRHLHLQAICITWRIIEKREKGVGQMDLLIFSLVHYLIGFKKVGRT